MRRCIALILTAISLCSGSTTIAAEDRIVLVAGGAGPEGGPATNAKLDGPFGVDFDREGNMFIVEIAGHRVLKVDRQGVLTRIACAGKQGNRGDGGPAIDSEFNAMHSLAVAPSGDIFIADTLNNRVRRIDVRTDKITAFAGTGTKGESGDGGPAVAAEFGGIYCVALDPKAERLLLTDLDNRRIRVVDLATGVVTTAAGNGQKGKPDDGVDARTAPLVDPRAAVMDSNGNLYVLERGGNALRVVDPAGKIRTLIGDGRGDTKLNGPKHLAIDLDGSVLIADTENHRIIKYLQNEQKSVVVAGTGEKGFGGVGGPPDKVQLNQPHGITVSRGGDLFISDSSNNRVLRIERPAVRAAAERAAIERWESAIRDFERKDKSDPPPHGEIVFVGSSSIRLWNLAESFADLKCINRGFGGSMMADSAHFADRIVVPYRPRAVVVYAGDNDIALGKSPEQIAVDAKSLTAAIHAKLPNTRVIFISIKPSLQRWRLFDKMQQANRLIADFARDTDHVGFLDITYAMFDSDGKPRAELFVKDGLHLSPDGYKIWADRLRPLLATPSQ